MNGKTILAAFLLSANILGVEAQNSTCSPYSQYGLGDLNSQANVAHKGMNGIGQGIRNGKEANFQNPASYSAIDSLTFIFDAGASANVTHYSEGGNTFNTRSASLDYVMALFRVVKHLGVSFGTMPYSSIGYNYYVQTSTYDLHNDRLNTDLMNDITYYGSGGFRQAYVGAGYAPFRFLSVGFNMSYFWGDYSKYISTVFGDGSTSDIKTYYATAKSWKLDAGFQYFQPVGKNYDLTVGATYSWGHEICDNAYCSRNEDAICTLSIPSSLKAGAVLKYGNQWRAGIDYGLMWFGKLDMPVYKDADETYKMKSGQLKNRHSINLGGEYIPGYRSRNYFKRIRYRAGLGYTSPYVKINGYDGPRELSASLGLGLPIQNTYNSRSVLNVAFQWINRSASNMIHENYFMISLGLCFNELWFAKWKAE